MGDTHTERQVCPLEKCELSTLLAQVWIGMISKNVIAGFIIKSNQGFPKLIQKSFQNLL